MTNFDDLKQLLNIPKEIETFDKNENGEFYFYEDLIYQINHNQDFLSQTGKFNNGNLYCDIDDNIALNALIERNQPLLLTENYSHTLDVDDHKNAIIIEKHMYLWHTNNNYPVYFSYFLYSCPYHAVNHFRLYSSKNIHGIIEKLQNAKNTNSTIEIIEIDKLKLLFNSIDLKLN